MERGRSPRLPGAEPYPEAADVALTVRLAAAQRSEGDIMQAISRTTAVVALLAQGLAGAAGARAPSGHPGVWTAAIEARSHHVFEEVFYGSAPAHVWLLGDGDSDLDLYVYDENEQLICASESFDDRERCSWTPRWTGKFYIKIVNHGTIPNVAEIGTYGDRPGPKASPSGASSTRRSNGPGST